MVQARLHLVCLLLVGAASAPALASPSPASEAPPAAGRPQDDFVPASMRGQMRLVEGGVSRAGVAAVDDLCAPCTDSAQCLSSLCSTDATTGDSMCTQACDASNACPPNFSCVTTADATTLCHPNDIGVCPSPYYASKNNYCQLAGTAANPNAGITRDCAAGLTCYLFPSQVGVCVTACSSLDKAAVCAPDETCCFDTASDFTCIKASSATKSTGGCFVVGDVGASCAAPDHSYCAAASICEYTQTSAAASCYATCNAGTCSSGGYCLTVNGAPVCCDARTLNREDVTTCVPQQGICRREVGVVCSVNADCRLGLCQKNGSQSACSVACQSDADCPGEDQDVNGDHVADGGSSCLLFGTNKRCWPLQGPAKPPACATAVAATDAPPSQGCQCAGGAAGARADLALLAPLAVVLWRRARRPQPPVVRR